MIDHTHAPDITSWVPGAANHADFPLQNLPFGVFSLPGQSPRGGVAIGDFILDMSAAIDQGLFSGVALVAAHAAAGPELNLLFSLPGDHRRALRYALFDLLKSASEARHRKQLEPLLVRAEHCTLHVPTRIGDYTDFYAGIVHAENVGRLLRPDNPLMPNYKHVPIGYHGRASTITASGVPVRRPWGQVRGELSPQWQPSARLDYEVELGIWIAGENAQGEPVSIADAHERIAGLCLLNDWSARDIQAWEYQPLGPFLAKNFASTISPWVITAEALAPYRVAQPRRPASDPMPLPYLLDDNDQSSGAYAIEIEVSLQTSAMRTAGMAPEQLGRTKATYLYWTPGQLIAHHTSGGCNLRPGDLIGTGTISAPDPHGYGSLMEVTHGGRDARVLANGEQRLFLEDGDTVVMTGRATIDGRVSIGLGRCEATVVAARSANTLHEGAA